MLVPFLFDDGIVLDGQRVEHDLVASLNAGGGDITLSLANRFVELKFLSSRVFGEQDREAFHCALLALINQFACACYALNQLDVSSHFVCFNRWRMRRQRLAEIEEVIERVGGVTLCASHETNRHLGR